MLPLMRALIFTVVTYVAMIGTGRSQERITFPGTESEARGGGQVTLSGALYRPATGGGPFAAIVGAHGCEGLTRNDGQLNSIYASWGETLADAGFVALFPDSFRSRGFGSQCATRPGERPVEANRERPLDAAAALTYLRAQPDVDAARIVMMGWSNGGQVVLWTIGGASTTRLGNGSDFRSAIALYPACQPILAVEWMPRVPLFVLMGESDNFTPAQPCRDLVTRTNALRPAAISIVLYPNTHHAFDHPNLPVQTLNNVRLPDGTSPTVGTNPESRRDAMSRILAYLRQL